MNDKKDYYVVKSNDFIRNTQSNLSSKQHQLVLYLISLIMPNTKKLKYSFSIKNYLGNENALGGASYQRIKNDIEKLCFECFIYNNGKEIIKIPIFKEVNISKQSGVIDVIFSREIEPYLFNLENNYTQYLLSNIKNLSHKHSIDLYEYFKSYEHSQDKLNFKVKKSFTDIKFKVNAQDKDTYSTYSQFNRKILKPAVDEINAKTDIFVTYSRIYEGRSVTHIEISVKQKKNIN